MQRSGDGTKRSPGRFPQAHGESMGWSDRGRPSARMAALALADPVGSTGQAMFRGGRQPKRTAQAGCPTPARTGLAPRRLLRRDRSLPQRSRAAPLAALKARPQLASKPRAGAPSLSQQRSEWAAAARPHKRARRQTAHFWQRPGSLRLSVVRGGEADRARRAPLILRAVAVEATAEAAAFVRPASPGSPNGGGRIRGATSLCRDSSGRLRGWRVCARPARMRHACWQANTSWGGMAASAAFTENGGRRSSGKSGRSRFSPGCGGEATARTAAGSSGATRQQEICPALKGRGSPAMTACGAPPCGSANRRHDAALGQWQQRWNLVLA